VTDSSQFGAVGIRSATPDDLPAIVALEGQSFAHGWSAQSWADEIDRHWVAVANLDRLVGVLAMSALAGVAEVRRIIVAPPDRRRGIGRGLLEHGLAWASAQECHEVFLEVSAANRGAIGLYESAGFVPLDRRAAYYGPGDDAVIYRRTWPSDDPGEEEHV